MGYLGDAPVLFILKSTREAAWAPASGVRRGMVGVHRALLPESTGELSDVVRSDHAGAPPWRSHPLVVPRASSRSQSNHSWYNGRNHRYHHCLGVSRCSRHPAFTHSMGRPRDSKLSHLEHPLRPPLRKKNLGYASTIIHVQAYPENDLIRKSPTPSTITTVLATARWGRWLAFALFAIAKDPSSSYPRAKDSRKRDQG